MRGGPGGKGPPRMVGGRCRNRAGSHGLRARRGLIFDRPKETSSSENVISGSFPNSLETEFNVVHTDLARTGSGTASQFY